MIKQSIIDVVEELRPSTLNSLSLMKGGLTPHFFDINAKQVYFYRFKEKEIPIDPEQHTLLEVSNLKFRNMYNRRNRLSFMDTMMNFINNGDIHPFLLFVNGAFIKWSDITIINEINKQYLLINKPKMDVNTVQALNLPFKVTYSETGETFGGTELFSFDENGLLSYGGTYKIVCNHPNLIIKRIQAASGFESMETNIPFIYKLLPDNVIVFRDKKIYSPPKTGSIISTGLMNLLTVKDTTSTSIDCLIIVDTRLALSKDLVYTFKNNPKLIQLAKDYYKGSPLSPAYAKELFSLFDFMFTRDQNYDTNINNGLLYTYGYNSRLFNKVYANKNVIRSATYTGAEIKAKLDEKSNLNLPKRSNALYNSGIMIFVNGRMYNYQYMIEYHTNRFTIPIIGIEDTDSVEILFIKYSYEDDYNITIAKNTLPFDPTMDINDIRLYSKEAPPTADYTFPDAATNPYIWYNVDFTIKGPSPSYAWKTVPSLPMTKNNTHGSGESRNATLSFGGINGPTVLTNTDLFDGSTWSAKANTNIGRFRVGSCGTSNDTFIYGGAGPTHATIAATEKYDGIKWTNDANMILRRESMGSCGTSNAALAVAGNSGSTQRGSERYNGITWVTDANISRIKTSLCAVGTINSAMIYGGLSNSERLTETERYNGLAWSIGIPMLIGKNSFGGCGMPNDALSIGGSNGNHMFETERFNGVEWTLDARLNVAKHSMGVGGNASSATEMGGVQPPFSTYSDVAESYIETGMIPEHVEFEDPFYYGKNLVLTQDNQFRHVGYNIQNESINKKLTHDFRYCRNLDRYMVFVDGVKINKDNYRITMPDPTVPINDISIYSNIVFHDDTHVDVFYMPFGYEEIEAIPTQDIVGDIVIDKSKISYNFSKDLYLFFVNGVKVNSRDIVDKENDKVCIIKNTDKLKNLSIIKYIEKEPDLESLMVTDSKLDSVIKQMNNKDFAQLMDITVTNTPDDGKVYDDLAANPITVVVNSANMNTARDRAMSAGEFNSALAIGGFTNPTTSVLTSELFNGTTWAMQQNINTKREYGSSSGISNSAIVFGGKGLNTAEEYDGVSWKILPSNMNANRYQAAGAGSRHSCVCASGYTGTNTISLNAEVYDSGTWSNTTNVIQPRVDANATGTHYETTLAAGLISISPIYAANTEKYNGKVWANSGAIINQTRNNAGAAGLLVGSSLIAGGNNGTTMSSIELCEADVYTVAGDMNTPRSGLRVCGTVDDAVFFGGFNTTTTNITENYTRQVNIIPLQYVLEKIARDYWLMSGMVNTGDIFVYNYEAPDTPPVTDSDGNTIVNIMDANRPDYIILD